MKRYTLKAAGLAATAALVLAACGGGDTDTAAEGAATADPNAEVTLNFTWWGNDDRAARYEEALDLSYLREYNENGHLLDLTEYLGDAIDTAEIDESLLASGQLDDAQVGIPTSTNTLALFYHPALLEQTGVEVPSEDYTWDEYNEFIAAVSAAGQSTPEGQPIYGAGDYTNTFWFFLQWLVQQGVESFTEDGEIGFDEEDMKEFLTSTEDLRADQAVYPVERGVQLLPLGGFTVNESATEISWDNFLAGYTADSGDENIQMLPVPSNEDGEKAMFFKPSMLLSAGANTEHPAEAAMLIDFLINDPEVGRIFGTSKGVPATQAQRDAMTLDEGSVDARVVAYEEAVADHVTEPVPVPVKGFGSIEAEYKRLAEELAYGTITADEFVESWFSEAALMTQ